MSRRRGANGITGPSSALTSFLREQGINTGPLNLYARRVTTAPAEEGATSDRGEEATEQVGETPGAGPSTATEAESTPTRRAGRTSKRKREEDEDFNSDNLDDDSENEQPVAASTRASTSKFPSEPTRKTATTRLTAKEKLAAKKKAKQAGTYQSGDEDDGGFSAPSRNFLSKPPIGSMDKCAKCGKKFTVTKYTQPASPPPGFLCHECIKAGGVDPFKKAAPPRRKLEDKRKIVSFEEKERIHTLTQMCISVITRHIDNVEALGSIGAANLDEICKIISRNRSLSPGNALLFYDAENTNLVLYDCTSLHPQALCTLATLNPNLRSLKLEFCGRMNSAVLAHWSSHFKELTSIDLLGPFNVHAEAWVSFISELRRPLEKFAVTQSPRLDMRCLQILQQRCGKSLKVLRLKEITKLDDEWLEVIKGFQNLTSLDISRPHQSVSDGALISLLSSGVGARLKHLDVSGHEELTDRSLLRGIGAFCAQLVSFAAADLALLSDEGVAMFFGGPKPEPLNDINPPSPTLGEEANDIEMTDGEVVPAENGMDAPVEPEGQPAIDEGPIPSSVLRPLESLDLSRCPCVGTLALSAMLAPPERADGRMGQSLLQTLNINQWKSCTNDALLAIGPALPNLRKINLGWCRNVDNFVMKALLDGCPKLNEILVSGCDLLDSNCPRRRGVVIRGIEPGV